VFPRSPHPSIHFPVETLRSIASSLACPPVNFSLGRFYQRKLKVTGGCLERIASPRNHFKITWGRTRKRPFFSAEETPFP